MAVTKTAIVEASIQILNRDGIEKLTMRTIAKELNIKAASLYNHIGGRQELFGEITEYMLGSCVFPENKTSPRNFLIKASQEYRNMLKTVRDSVAIFENSVPNTPRRTKVIQSFFEKLYEYGVRQENLLTVSNMLNNYTLSFTADELRYKNTPPEILNPLMEKFSFGNKLFEHREINFDRQFLYGLEVLFTGIKKARVQNNGGLSFTDNGNNTHRQGVYESKVRLGAQRTGL